MANIVIDIAAEFTGKNAFKQAETSTDKLTKNLKSVAKTLGVAFGVQQVLAFGKASVKAAAADEKAQKQLALALKNVGLGRDVAASEAFIQKLQSEFGVVDDKLRPAYQQLAVATGDTAQSQKLLQIALDISASTGRDLASVTGAISKAYLGNNTALGKLGVGISKADLKAKSFDEVMNQLSDTFAGSATASANTFQGSMDKLAVASNNVQEIIGKGLIDAFKMLGDDGSVDNLAVQMESVAIYIADSIRGIGVLVGYIQSASDAAAKIPFLSQITDSLLKLSPLFGGIVGLNSLGSKAAADAAHTGDTAQALAHLAELESRYANVTLATKKKITTEEAKQLKDKKLKLAIDKANLALGKGSDVFDMEKISLAAAEKNAAEQLGKVTSQAQLLQITNDLARLEVKQSILALEEAIASKDVAAITAATNKLNADLGILGVLTGQKIKLTEIETILKGILPKDLINLANLNEAIRLLGVIGAGTGGTVTKNATPILGDPNKSSVGIPTALTAAEINALLIAGSFVPSGGSGGSSSAGAYASSGFPGAQKNGGITVVVNVNAGTIAKPDELTTLIQDAVISLNKRGDLLTYAGSL
jgi:hypothetical protein